MIQGTRLVNRLTERSILPPCFRDRQGGLRSSFAARDANSTSPLRWTHALSRGSRSDAQSVVRLGATCCRRCFPAKNPPLVKEGPGNCSTLNWTARTAGRGSSLIEKDEGSGRLTSLSDDRFEMAVEYSITFRRELRNVQPGLQPVADLTTTVHYIRSIGSERYLQANIS